MRALFLPVGGLWLFDIIAGEEDGQGREVIQRTKVILQFLQRCEIFFIAVVRSAALIKSGKKFGGIAKALCLLADVMAMLV